MSKYSYTITVVYRINYYNFFIKISKLNLTEEDFLNYKLEFHSQKLDTN